jgi:hypothetical protein
MFKWLSVVLAVGAFATPAFAQGPSLSGAWKLSAKVASVPFNLICRFEQMGDQLGGTCVKPSAGHAEHGVKLTAGKVDGDHITFTHRGSFLLNKFDVTYAGVLEGDRINGQINVFGHKGDFIAVRDDS